MNDNEHYKRDPNAKSPLKNFNENGDGNLICLTPKMSDFCPLFIEIGTLKGTFRVRVPFKKFVVESFKVNTSCKLFDDVAVTKG